MSTGPYFDGEFARADAIKFRTYYQSDKDLRRKDPRERAEAIIGHCVDPSNQDLLWNYFNLTEHGHTPQSFRSTFAIHEKFQETCDMRYACF